MNVVFETEKDFEDALVDTLVTAKGWHDGVLDRPSERDLVENWRRILSENNKGIDALNGCPLTDGEMRQVLDKVEQARTPANINRFINGRTVSIVRDNPDDRLHLGQTVSLHIYSRDEIAGGKSRYQIARQPVFTAQSAVRNRSRGDVMLLVNGMPVIHIELKRSGIPVGRAVNQIETYSAERAFTGLFSLVQVFVAMQPDDTLYFANPGTDGAFSPKFMFRWASEENAPYTGWRDIAERLLSIPMAHMLIGFYTVADASDGELKVMRSYQYYAARAILGKVMDASAWDGGRGARGGYVWHATGSGKTLTSYKAAQLVRDTGRADKVVFLVDRTELSTQTFENYEAFAGVNDTVNATEDTHALVALLRSPLPDHSLIVTSIQKMGFLDDEGERGFATPEQIREIDAKKLVFVVDECHRSTFGKRMGVIKRSFPHAMLFGFTGTPIKEENARKGETTADIFGEELHVYTLANGISDGNVLGLDLNKCTTYADYDLRHAVALEKARAGSEDGVWGDSHREAVFNRWMNEVPMAAAEGPSIEGCVPSAMYDCDAHRREVVRDIGRRWSAVSQGGRLHALLATHSIKEAIEYYRLLKVELAHLNVTAVFEDSDPACADAAFKRAGLDEITRDYNELFGTAFKSGAPGMKKDVCLRLAHKEAYKMLRKGEQIDILVVVDQLLTGFDSKWIGALYLDKMLEYERVVQAFSRTNRQNAQAVKPFGSIFYYRKPHTMEANIAKAIEMYSDGRGLPLFVDKLDVNVEGMNEAFAEIRAIFLREGLEDFSRLPDNEAARGAFASEFRRLNGFLEAAQVQGFTFEQSVYEVDRTDGERATVTCEVRREDYLALLARYKDLAAGAAPGGGPAEVPYDIDAHIVALDTERIDAAYMQSRFLKWVELKDIPDRGQEALDELHSQFARLSASDQRYAEMVISDIQAGKLVVEAGKDFMQYIVEYRKGTFDGFVDSIVDALGINRNALVTIVVSSPSESDLDAHGRYTYLEGTIDKTRAKEYFERVSGHPMKPKDVNREARTLLRRFVLSGGFDINGDQT